MGDTRYQFSWNNVQGSISPRRVFTITQYRVTCFWKASRWMMVPTPPFSTPPLFLLWSILSRFKNLSRVCGILSHLRCAPTATCLCTTLGLGSLGQISPALECLRKHTYHQRKTTPFRGSITVEGDALGSLQCLFRGCRQRVSGFVVSRSTFKCRQGNISCNRCKSKHDRS